jgi:lactoylglutathione lyase
MRFSQVRLLVDDVGPCYRFYRDILGLEPTSGDEGDAYASFAGGVALFLRGGQEAVVDLRPAGDGALVCLAADDLDSELERIRQAGGEPLGAPTAQPDWGIRVAYLRDPAGNLVELHEEIPMSEE